MHVRDVATVLDGGEEPVRYVRFASATDRDYRSAVTLALSKRRGANAIDVSTRVLARLERLRGEVVPSDVEVTVTRHYGRTAQEKSNELLGHIADRHGGGVPPDLADPGLPRVVDRLPRHPDHALPDPGLLLSLRLHPEPDHAVSR